MWPDFLRWWQSLWSDPTVVGGAVAGFVSALIMFLVGDVIWKSRLERVKSQREFQQKQLDNFYAPLYRFYREAYARFDLWRKGNPDTKLKRQPFFESDSDEEFVEKIFSQHPGYASQAMLSLWSSFTASDDRAQRNIQRQKMIETLVKEYHGLRKRLGLDYDKFERKSGEFSSG
jgi:hypothetical protein